MGLVKSKTQIIDSNKDNNKHKFKDIKLEDAQGYIVVQSFSCKPPTSTSSKTTTWSFARKELLSTIVV